MNRFIPSMLCVLSIACSSAGSREAAAPTDAPTCVGGIARNDAELERYRGCRKISGDLAVRGVTSLDALQSLVTVEGTLGVEHTRTLYTLAGLERLRNVDTLDIRNNGALIHAGAIRNLEKARRAHFADNPRLSAQYGFVDAIRRSAAEVHFSGNWGLAAEGVPQSPTHVHTIASR